jgi:hypothetical protein
MTQEEALLARRQKAWKEVRDAHARVDSAQNHQIDTVFPKLPGVVKKATKVASSALVGAGLSPFYAVTGAELGISKARKAAAKKLSTMYPKSGGKP